MGDGAAGAELDVVFFEPGGVLGEEIFARFGPAEEFLAERGAVVRAVDFLGDEQEGAVVVEFADGLGGATAGQAAAYEEIFHVKVVHTSTSPRFLDATIIGLFGVRASADRCSGITGWMQV